MPEKTKLPVLSASAESAVQLAADRIRAGALVAFPTESVYGLGANATDPVAVSSIFLAKKRPQDNPLITHISSMQMCLDFGISVPDLYIPLLTRFWPGPLTILVPRPDSIPEIVTAGHDVMAIRIPSHKFALEFIQAAGVPIAAPSANVSGRPSPTSAEHVLHDFSTASGPLSLIVDGGDCTVGVESTVLNGLCSPPEILRPGGITLEMIQEFPGFERTVCASTQCGNASVEAPVTPGMKYTHYTPDARVVLVLPLEEGKDVRNRVRQVIGEERAMAKSIGVLKCSKDRDYSDMAEHEIFLGDEKHEIAQHIFSGLRKLEAFGLDCIIVEGVDEGHQGAAIMNRLSKASSRIA